MHRQLMQRSGFLVDPYRARWPPPISRSSRKPPKAAGSFAKDAPSEQPSPSRTGPTTVSGDPNVTVVEATVLESGTVLQGKPEGLSGSGEAAILEHHPDYPEVPASTTRAAALQYGGLAAAYAVVSGAVAVAAVNSPAVLLPGADPWASTLLGCLSAVYLRLAGVCLHLKVAADNQELLCWRHQRLALMAALYGVLAALTQVSGVTSLQLAGLQLVLAVATAATVVNVARNCYAVRPFVWTVVEKAEGSLGGVLAALAQAALAAVSTVAGLVLLALTAMSLCGFAAVVLSPAPSLPAPLGSWPGQAESLSSSAAGLRRLVGAGMLLAAAQAHGLLDFAEYVQRGPQPGDLEALKRLMVEYLVRTKDTLHKYYLPGPWTYNALNASMVAATTLTGVFLARGQGLGVDVNWDAALWGPLYGTVALTGVYALVVVSSFDWRSVADTTLRFFVWAGDMVLGFFHTFVWRFEWAERRRRV